MWRPPDNFLADASFYVAIVVWRSLIDYLAAARYNIFCITDLSNDFKTFLFVNVFHDYHYLSYKVKKIIFACRLQDSHKTYFPCDVKTNTAINGTFHEINHFYIHNL